MEDDLDIATLIDGGDEWSVTLDGGEELTVPKDPRNGDHQRVLRWVALGGTVTPGEIGARRRLRKRLKAPGFERALVLELASITGRTPKQMRDALLEHITG